MLSDTGSLREGGGEVNLAGMALQAGLQETQHVQFMEQV